MNVDQMTLGQLKELIALFGQKEKNDPITKTAIGRYVIVRTRNEGINCGKVLFADKSGVVIQDARRIYYHKPKDSNLSWYEGVAESGLHSDSKISGTVSMKYIIEDYSLTICSTIAEQSLRSHVATTS
jgi:hypothetical protein